METNPSDVVGVGMKPLELYPVGRPGYLSDRQGRVYFLQLAAKCDPKALLYVAKPGIPRFEVGWSKSSQVGYTVNLGTGELEAVRFTHEYQVNDKTFAYTGAQDVYELVEIPIKLLSLYNCGQILFADEHDIRHIVVKAGHVEIKFRLFLRKVKVWIYQG